MPACGGVIELLIAAVWRWPWKRREAYRETPQHVYDGDEPEPRGDGCYPLLSVHEEDSQKSDDRQHGRELVTDRSPRRMYSLLGNDHEPDVEQGVAGSVHITCEVDNHYTGDFARATSTPKST